MSCKKPYIPPVIAAQNNYLVVEGVINTNGNDTTHIKLSRTVNLGESVTNNPETGATVTVENDQKIGNVLTEETPGNYVLAPSNFDASHKYRINIKTADNKQYVSDFVDVNITPPIDSIGFTVKNNNLQIYANTHDPNNNTHYYRWDYTETWIFNAEYVSEYVSTGTAMVQRDSSNRINTCWQNNVSSTIVLSSSAKLSQDVIYQAPITSIESTSEKIEKKYSILLYQYALTADAYLFWQNLKKNTEQLGSIFDAQPSQISGNIHNVANAAEPVIGYISACAVQTKRVYISKDQLPISWEPTYPFACHVDSNYFSDPINGVDEVKQSLVYLPPAQIAMREFYKAPDYATILGFLGTSKQCGDCTIRGTNIQPAFWK